MAKGYGENFFTTFPPGERPTRPGIPGSSRQTTGKTTGKYRLAPGREESREPRQHDNSASTSPQLQEQVYTPCPRPYPTANKRRGNNAHSQLFYLYSTDIHVE
ncbi:hypothetical protein [Butyricimonas virosa]|uniref:Uncharacterized protein n=1 Tax=Butyricimonas virosa TaxID=544645 RepID=A0ABX7H5G1_9BACT|nr:hypothetical protein [Butyricimonas virosa]MCI6414225.1 hypothetical protein [Butyricimonas virosa]MCI7161856.1 hypothetical protein [Butyricimonas virosa]MCI7293595.1 hypothetical protein [Butyricimonas virosa]MDY5012091.1 hypothetical protein [Butyricimonas virosa]MDY6219407.1 hypothetical protein [Butyricimonas virosa]